MASPLQEDWSPQARVAALLVRRRNRGLRTTPETSLGPNRIRLEEYFHQQVSKLKHGQSVSVDLPEGQVSITRRTAEGHLSGPLRDFHVGGGGAHTDPELRRGPRNIVGTHLVATEAAERVRNTIAADKAHTAEAVHRVETHARARLQSLTGHAATISRTKAGYHVTYPGHDDLKATVHADATAAVSHAKRVLRGSGAKFLPEGHDTDPLSTLPTTKRALRQAQAADLRADVVKSAKEKYFDPANPDHSAAMTDVAPEVTGAVATASPLAPSMAPHTGAAHLVQAGTVHTQIAMRHIAVGPHGVTGHAVTMHLIHNAHHGVYLVHHVATMFQDQDLGVEGDTGIRWPVDPTPTGRVLSPPARRTAMSLFDNWALAEGKLSAAARDALPKTAFALPGERRYPIHDKSHARNALARCSGKPEEAKVKAAVYARYPALKEDELVEHWSEAARKAAREALAGKGRLKVGPHSHGYGHNVVVHGSGHLDMGTSLGSLTPHYPVGSSKTLWHAHPNRHTTSHIEDFSRADAGTLEAGPFPSKAAAARALARHVGHGEGKIRGA